MRSIEGGGLRLAVPPAWEARIVTRQAVPRVPGPTGEAVAASWVVHETVVAHLATFALPAELGDFGGGAVNLMGGRDVFLVLFEYGAESLGAPLFEARGLPRLGVADFSPAALRRAIPGQSATQRFFTHEGRPFCVYAVLGSHRRRVGLVPQVNDALAGVAVAPR